MMKITPSRLEMTRNAFNLTLAAWHIWVSPGLGEGQLYVFAAQGFHNLSGFGEYFMALQRHYIFSAFWKHTIFRTNMDHTNYRINCLRDSDRVEWT